jgi:hypothetical protein
MWRVSPGGVHNLSSLENIYPLYLGMYKSGAQFHWWGCASKHPTWTLWRRSTAFKVLTLRQANRARGHHPIIVIRRDHLNPWILRTDDRTLEEILVAKSTRICRPSRHRSLTTSDKIYDLVHPVRSAADPSLFAIHWGRSCTFWNSGWDNTR